ncbi:hypothetical protein QNM99_24640 [Pseudomonas sp. PCH446]
MKPDTESECLLHTPYFDVVKERGYFVIKEAQAINGVVAVPVLPDGRLMLAVLRRRAIGAQSIEFPVAPSTAVKPPATPPLANCWKKPAGRP